jgi:hypothetical protein
MATISSPPAGGATAGQVLLGALASAIISGTLLYLGLGHRAGRIKLLEQAGRITGRVTGLPPWAAVPLALALPAFALAGFGFVWDVSIHVDNGRDTGPFGTPAHFFMLAGIFTFLASGWFAVAMPKATERGASWIRLSRDWHAPAGGVVMLTCAAVSLTGFPLDDLWHRMFGQDVTLWGPTHQMMINGGLFNFVGLMMLLREARVAKATTADASELAPPRPSFPGLLHAAVILAGLTIAYQQEFAYGVPEYRLLFQPELIALTGALVLTGARLTFGPGAAIGTALIGVAALGLLTLLVGPVAGQATHHFPLYFAEAGLVEIAARAARRRGPYTQGAIAGALVGSIGVLAEYGWSHVWMPIPWPAHILGEAVLRCLPPAIAAGICGAWIAYALRRTALPGATPAPGGTPDPRATPPRARRLAPALGLAVIVVSLGSLLPTTAPPVTATVTLADVNPAPKRTVTATVRFSPAAAVKNPDWLYAFAWQGKENRNVVGKLRSISPGVYRTTLPLPAYGTWKALIRFSRGSAFESVPVYMPLDRAIPAAEIPALRHFTRRLIGDHRILQRERKRNVPEWLFGAASTVVAALVIALVCLLGWALQRITGAAGPFGGGMLRRRPVPTHGAAQVVEATR